MVWLKTKAKIFNNTLITSKPSNQVINIILAFSYYWSYNIATLTISRSLIMFFAINGVMLIIKYQVQLSPWQKIINGSANS